MNNFDQQSNKEIIEIANSADECLDTHIGTSCHGPVEYRFPLSASGKSFPRCQKHWEERLAEQKEIDERYPQTAPEGFDPSYAGEYWGEEY